MLLSIDLGAHSSCQFFRIWSCFVLFLNSIRVVRGPLNYSILMFYVLEALEIMDTVISILRAGGTSDILAQRMLDITVTDLRRMI